MLQGRAWQKAYKMSIFEHVLELYLATQFIIQENLF